MWEFNAVVQGYIKANTQTEKGNFASEEEKDEVFDWLMAQETKTLKTYKNKVYTWDGINFTVQKEVEFELEI